jgi:hypothetical protein
LGLEGNEVTGDRRKLLNRELYDLYSSPNIILVIESIGTRWAGNVACMGVRKGAYRVVAGRPEGKRLLGKPRHRCEYDIKMNV